MDENGKMYPKKKDQMYMAFSEEEMQARFSDSSVRRFVNLFCGSFFPAKLSDKGRGKKQGAVALMQAMVLFSHPDTAIFQPQVKERKHFTATTPSSAAAVI